ncbi:MAG: phosphate acyltransferase PlsX [Christensenellaceae bacterium]|nr:phosphate acyltransferase PlsX [Christensenellaceae bacterium]
MRIYLDAMGGDNAPEATVLGSLQALDRFKDLTIILAGIKEEIEKYLVDKNYDKNRLIIEEANELIGNDESPVMAIRRKKDSAIVKGMLALKNKEVDAFVSAGSTGAVLAGGMFRLGRIKGIERPALAPLLPNGKDFFLLIDCGANVDCKPEYLKQFALMGNAYMKSVRNLENPRIGLLNNGAEAEKGNELTKAAYKLIEATDLNFVGNIEGREVTHDIADVLVCDGFSGNIILKFMEGVVETLMGMIKKELTSDTLSKIGALLAKPAFKRVKKSMDYSEVGGAPLLGVNGVVVKAHGSSNAYSITSAIAQTVHMVDVNLSQRIESSLTADNACK